MAAKKEVHQNKASLASSDRTKKQWLILNYKPVSFFSLRMTHATSKGGKTLLVPTPYAFKMALIDACFRAFEGVQAETEARELFDNIKAGEIRFRPPEKCLVQNTFIKIRQEERGAPKGIYASTIAYREFCYFTGLLSIAIGIKNLSEESVLRLEFVARHINTIGKRGSFWQFIGHERHESDLPVGYTSPRDEANVSSGEFATSHFLDDFGEALCRASDGFNRINTYGSGTIKLGEHRALVPTLLPYRFVRSSRHFTFYERISL